MNLMEYIKVNVTTPLNILCLNEELLKPKNDSFVNHMPNFLKPTALCGSHIL